MILIQNINIPLNTDFSRLIPVAARELKLSENNVISAKLYRKSVDARHKSDVHFCCSLLAELSINEEKAIKKCKNAQIFIKKEYKWQKAEKQPKNPPIIAGFGPAGMFAALTLARAGLKPIVVERGSCVEKRTKAVERFFTTGELDNECNIQFGEGGAGTFSDGKLTTGIKNPRCKLVLEVLSEMGAGEKILTDAKPHIGTDVLVEVVKNIRKEIIALGGEVLFDSKLTGITVENSQITKAEINGEFKACDCLILATGHSARDTYRMLLENGIQMQKKPFAVGVRIEHLQSDINRALYGDFADSEYLSAADYKLATHLKGGRSVYTFCMCPGGEVINASSFEGGIAVNGMSNSRRDGANANSALLVNVTPDDFPEDDVLAGTVFQEKIERAAYSCGFGKVPVNTVGSFVFGKDFKIGRVMPTVKPDYVCSDFSDIFPDFVTDSLKEGIVEFGKKIKGFDQEDAVLTAPETRSSAPVRIMRDENLNSCSVKGLLPCGEGAGYAGGIVSAAVDGICVAEAVINEINKN